MNFTRLIPSGLIVWCLLGCSCATRHSVRPSLPAASPFDEKTGADQRIFLTLHLEDGKDLLFLADTGAEGTLLDTSLEPRLGKPLAPVKVDWNALGVVTNGNLYAAPKLYLGQTRLLTGDRMVTDDLTRMSADRPVMGILGMDCLRHYCLQLDLADHQIRFLDPDQKMSGQQFPLALSWLDGKPRLRARFFGRSAASYLIDTGCPDDMDLEPKLFAREAQSLPDQDTNQYQYSKQFKLPSGMAKHFIIYPKINFNGEACTNFVLADGPAGNLLGLRFLARHVATLNFPKRTLTLQPAPGELFAGDARATDRILQQVPSPAVMLEAEECLEKLKKQGDLPGWKKEDQGRCTLAWTTDEKPPDSDLALTFVLTKTNDPTQYHCALVRTARDLPWQLQRAWRTDAQGRVIKEWPVKSKLDSPAQPKSGARDPHAPQVIL